MNKNNFQCPRCKKKVRVGKKLHAEYTCPICKNQIVIDREERQQGHVTYKKNFLIQR